jgi:hypothetical protein
VVGNPQPVGNIYGAEDRGGYDPGDCDMLCPDGTSGCWCPAE